MPKLPPSAHWPLDASSVEEGHPELQHQSPSGSAGQSHSLCCQWSGELGSGGQANRSKKWLGLPWLTLCHRTVDSVWDHLGTLIQTLPWHWAPHGSWAPPTERRCQFLPQPQYDHCHHLRGRRLPSMRQTRCPYHWGGATGSEREAPEGQLQHISPLMWASFWTEKEWSWGSLTYLHYCRQGWKWVLISAQVG